MDYLIDPYRFKAALKLTSYLYPYHFIEYVDITHAFTGGEMYTWPLENVDITHAFTGGTLT